MSEPFLQRLFSYKLLVYLKLLIILWKSGSDCKFQASAAYPDLPSNEVSSLITITRQFKSKISFPAFSKSYCQNQMSNYGVTIKCADSCNNYTGTECYIEEISLSTMGLIGTIDAAVGDLQNLKKLVLSYNKLQGPIPAGLGNLLSLTTLDLSNNQLTGTIPDSLGYLTSLRWLYLRYNYLQGSIPSSLGQLTLLEDLFLDFNMLSGSIPEDLGHLSKLKRLTLNDNRLSGRLPSTLGNLTSLTALYLSSNYFTGKLPDGFGQLRSLNWFVVAGNQLSGPLPRYVKNWTQIENLAFQGNNFEGDLPEEYFTLSSLSYLMVSDLTPKHPLKLPQTTDFSNIYTLILRNCSITGSIPNYIGELSSLKHLDLSFNRLTGRIPESMRSNLNYMSLARNKLNGTIPNWIFQASQTRLDLSYNNFSELKSPVPSGLDLNLFACCCCQSSATTEPYMLPPDQMMDAYIPGKPKFYSLFINSGGEKTTFNGKDYEADNETTPFYLSPMRNWAYSFSGDFLVVTANSSDYTKRVPCKLSNSGSSLYEEARLSPVALTYHGFSLKRGPYNVTLHFAEIVYINDGDYNDLRTRLFNVYIQGKWVLQDFNIREEAGGPNKALTRNFTTEVNNGLLTIHLFWAGKGSFVNGPAFNGPLLSAISVDPLFGVAGEGLPPWCIALISAASLIGALLLLLAFAWSRGWLEDKELQELIKIGEVMEKGKMTSQPKEGENDIKVHLKELVSGAKNFSDRRNMQLEGEVLEKVYEAEVKSKDRTVAVKKLFPGKMNEFIKQDIYYLTALEHKNLIKLWDIHVGKRLQLLVYEYMQKKSLDSALLDPKTSEPLNWETRFKICKGIAEGLEVLHIKQQRFKIVHGNIKASSILLDGDFNPKLSDFGLAKVYTDDDKVKSMIKEAPKGYLAPEYPQVRSPTSATDIFSFGVVLLEIVCGKKNKVPTPNEESRYLLDEAHRHSKSGNKRGLENLVDEKISKNMTADELNEAVDVLNLAVMCTEKSPSCRPNISHILSVLNRQKTIDEIRQAIDASNKKDTSEVADKNDESKPKEMGSNVSTSSDSIEHETR